MTEAPTAPPVLPVVIECSLHEADYLALRKHGQKAVYRQLLPAMLVVIGLLLLLSWFGNPSLSIKERAYSLLFTVFLCVGILGGGFAYLQWFYLPRLNRRYLGALGKCRFEVSPDGFIERSAWGSTELLLPGIKSVEEAAEHFFVMSKSGVAFVIPKHALGTFAPFETLRERVKAQNA